jgi:hypothetical protein
MVVVEIAFWPTSDNQKDDNEALGQGGLQEALGRTTGNTKRDGRAFDKKTFILSPSDEEQWG